MLWNMALLVHSWVRKVIRNSLIRTGLNQMINYKHQIQEFVHEYIVIWTTFIVHLIVLVHPFWSCVDILIECSTEERKSGFEWHYRVSKWYFNFSFHCRRRQNISRHIYVLYLSWIEVFMKPIIMRSPLYKSFSF